MNNADKHIDTWSMTDVQRYLNGELSSRERHDLEKQALDDPFLADALEGLQTRSGETLHQDLAELRTRLDIRVATNRKRLWLPPVRAAAVIILLVGLGFTAYRTLFYKGQPATAPTAATHEPPPAASDAAPAAAPTAKTAPAPTTTAHQAPRDSAAATVAVATAPTRHPADREVIARGKADTKAPAESKADTRALAEDNIKPVESRVPPAALAAVRINQPMPKKDGIPDSLNIHKDTTPYLANVDESKTRVSLGSSANLLSFSGRVLDLNNRPVAGAALLFKNGNTGTVTDDNGQFNLYIPQKDTTRQLTVAMEGYEETQYALNTEDRHGNTIILRQSPARLDEVVVSGIGAKRKEYMAAPPSDAPETLDSLWLNTAPAMGRIAYLNYLATARKTLPVDTTIHGTESISFQVDKKGALTEFKIERSLSPAHDAGVIRLITEGPPWKILHGRRARALVNVTFP